eukprot:2981149-Pleurochrysis_carterae.AAC.1
MERMHDLQPSQRLRQVFGQGFIRAPHRLIGREGIFLSQTVIVDCVIASIDGPSHCQQSSLHRIP